MDLSLHGSMYSVMGRKFHLVEKVHSLILLVFTNFIVLEIENYLSLISVRNVGVGEERMD